MKLRIFTLALALILLTSAFAACQKAATPDNTPAKENTPASYSLPTSSSASFSKPCNNARSDEQLLEDFGGAQGADSGVVQPVIADDDVKHPIAFLTAETEYPHIAEGHARQQMDDLGLTGLQVHVALYNSRYKHTIGHIKPVPLTVTFHIGLYA